MLRDRINDEVKDAMRAGDTRRRDALRLLSAALKQTEVDERKALTDSDIVAIIDKMIKQRRESIVQFDAGNRPELSAAERAEIELLQAYMPQPLSEAEVDGLIDAAVAAGVTHLVYTSAPKARTSASRTGT